MNRKAIVLDFIKKCTCHEHVILSSGEETDLYYDLRPAMMTPYFLDAVVTIIHDEMHPQLTQPYAVGGPKGALPLITWYMIKYKVPAFFVADDKVHGVDRAVCGVDPRSVQSILLVDDVCTSGGTLVRVNRILKVVGYDNAVYAMVVLKRTREERIEQPIAIVEEHEL